MKGSRDGMGWDEMRWYGMAWHGVSLMLNTKNTTKLVGQHNMRALSALFKWQMKLQECRRCSRVLWPP